MPAQGNMTIVEKPALTPAQASGGQPIDSPWLRAAILTPSFSNSMTTTRLGAIDMRPLQELLHKPSHSLATCFRPTRMPAYRRAASMVRRSSFWRPRRLRRNRPQRLQCTQLRCAKARTNIFCWRDNRQQNADQKNQYLPRRGTEMDALLRRILQSHGRSPCTTSIASFWQAWHSKVRCSQPGPSGAIQ